MLSCLRRDIADIVPPETRRPCGRRLMTALAAAGLAVGVPGQASAHHSYAVFDASRTVKLQGTVTAFEWVNPHCWLRIMVPDPAGKPVVWDFELGPPLGNAKRGLVPKNLKAGDKVTVTANPRRDGTSGGGLVSIVLADGRAVALR